MKIYKTAIIGGGASGLLCAVELLRGENAFNANDFIVIEKNDRVGKKLSATGNGQGNVLNKNFDSKFYHGDKSFILTLVNKIKEIGLESYLYSLGIPTFYDEENRGYPYSKQATSLTDALRFFLGEKGVEIKTSTAVKNVQYKGDTFEITCENCKIKAYSVVLASGGMAGKQFGTDGELYKIPISFGHEMVKTYPSLVQIKTDVSKIKGLKNLKETVNLSAEINGNKTPSFQGDLLFTDYGISGSAVFKLSPYLSGQTEAEINVEFLPCLNYLETEKLIADKIKNYPIKDREEILSGIINKKIGQAVIKTCINYNEKDVAFALKNFRLKYLGTLGFDYAQVTKGGIETEKINPLTLESKIRRGLYLVGEILNVDGDCGGYNLMLAFGTGILSAKHIKEKFSKNN